MTALEIGWLIGLVLGLALLPVVALLLHRVLRPLLEARRYAEDILASGLGIAENLDGVDEAVETARLAGTLPGLAGVEERQP